MLNRSNVARKFILITAATMLVIFYPLEALAYGAAACPTANGTNSPTGAAAKTYNFNSDTCLWENDYYTWNPATKQTQPKFDQTYTYNASSKQYDTTVYMYNAAAGKYDAVVLSVTQPPAGATVVGTPDPITAPTASSSNQPLTDIASPKASTPDSTGDGSLGTYNTAGNVTVNNTLVSTANSGDTLVLGNTTAGSATSGNAVAMATVLNILQSTTSLPGTSVTTFTQNVGDWNGDLVIDPSALSSLSTINSNNTPNNLSINAKTSGQINNDINLTAASGNATVARNTTAGSATTGSADAIANIVNVINSVIGAGQSFVGTINVNGNLNGDILLPPDTLNSLLASNAAPTTVTTMSDSPDTLNTTINNNSSITNNLNLNSQSGTATISGNTNAGSATTGAASTNITLLNLTGQQVVGKDALLVFVNVMGNWVGMIVNAPSGATAAALGGGITADSALATNADINATTNNSINNNVNLNSTSGNALVNRNTTAGNATSGNASVNLNLLNISTSSLSLSNWLGVLFINVFGSWNGSFGIDTAAGNNSVSNTGSTTPDITPAVQAVKVFSFVPNSANSSYQVVPLASADSSTNPPTPNHPVVLSATTNNPPSSPSSGGSMLLTAGSMFLVVGIISAEEAISHRKAAQAKFRQYLDSITVQPLKRY